MSIKQTEIDWENLYEAARRLGVSEFVLNQFQLINPYGEEVIKHDADSREAQDARQ